MKTNIEKEAGLESQELLQYALTASEEGIWDWDLKNNTGYLSPRYYEMLGYEANEFPGTGEVWLNMVHPDDRSRAVQKSRDIIQKKLTSYQSVYRLLAKDGTYRWILSRALVVRWDENGTPTRLVGTHMDITESREKDEALRRHKENLEKEVEKQTRELKATNRQLETIINASSEGIWVCDGKGIILTVNKAAEKLSNIKRDEVTGKNIKDFEKSGFIDRSITRDVIEKGKTVSRIQELKHQNKQLLVIGTPVINDQNKIDLIVVNERDLTHLNQLRDQLEEARLANIRYKEELTNVNLKELKDQDIIAESKEMRQVIAIALKLSRRKASPILIVGESGTGKGLMAKFLHSKTFGQDNPFIQINCAALPETLLEAELFGYEKGAFTGALDQGKIGLFEMAEGGTIFLDELGDMSLSIQAKLLKCLEEKTIMHLGGLKPIKIKCNIIAATNKNLAKQVENQAFRKDLFFRLNTFTITVPPLRTRPEDILEMTMFFLKKYSYQYGVQRYLSSKCRKKIQTHPFPGNIRELKNMLKKAVVLGEDDIMEDLADAPFQNAMTIEDIGNSSVFSKNHSKENFSFHKRILAYEKELFCKALETYKTTRSLAKVLELSQASIVRKLRIHGLSNRLKRNAGKH